MKVLGLISSLADPASRFRILQYKEELKKNEVQLDCKIYFPKKESDPPRVFNLFSKNQNIKAWQFLQRLSRQRILSEQNKYDLIWQNRLLLYNTFGLETKLKKPRVFDFDDAIWMTEGREQVDAAIKTAEVVFAGNEFLAQYAVQLNRNTHVIPTTMDTSIYYDQGNTNPSVFTLGWVGTESNFPYLEMIKAPVLEFLRTEKTARLMIVSSVMPANFSFDQERIIFCKWSADNENELINQFSVGLMPLADSEWTKGKCSAKMLQYLSCKRPVIVSPVGTNKTILSEANVGISAVTDAEWLAAFKKLKYETETCSAFGNNGRALVEKKYATNVWTPAIISHFQKLVQ
jgi:glycosyltransferase involved in cell wall biosynthesis